MNLCVASGIIVRERFECKNYPTVDTGRLLAFNKFRRNTKSSTVLCVEALQLLTFRFWKGPSLVSAFRFRIRVGDLQAAPGNLNVSNGAVVEQSRTVKSQFLHHPITKVWNLRAWHMDKAWFCQLKSLLWQIFFFISFLSESISYVGFGRDWYFGSFCFKTNWVLKFL